MSTASQRMENALQLGRSEVQERKGEPPDLNTLTHLSLVYTQATLATGRSPSRQQFARLARSRSMTREQFVAWAKGRAWRA